MITMHGCRVQQGGMGAVLAGLACMVFSCGQGSIHSAPADESAVMRSCGAMSHATKDCMERPRSKGAKWTGKHIAADEKVENIMLETYEARRDRWNGYDSTEYTRVVDRRAPLLLRVWQRDREGRLLRTLCFTPDLRSQGLASTIFQIPVLSSAFARHQTCEACCLYSFVTHR